MQDNENPVLQFLGITERQMMELRVIKINGVLAFSSSLSQFIVASYYLSYFPAATFPKTFRRLTRCYAP